MNNKSKSPSSYACLIIDGQLYYDCPDCYKSMDGQHSIPNNIVGWLVEDGKAIEIKTALGGTLVVNNEEYLMSMTTHSFFFTKKSGDRAPIQIDGYTLKEALVRFLSNFSYTNLSWYK